MQDRHSPPSWLTAVPALIAVVALAAACSGSPAEPGQVSLTPGGAADGSSGPGAAASSSTGGDIDPCKVLTKADVQPFFSVPVVTELPGPFLVGHTCEWAANDAPGGVSTSLDINVRTGQDALDGWSMAHGPTETSFSGVGDQAEHAPGITDFVSIKGQVLCGLTTLGYQHLAGKADFEPGSMPDADATRIAQQYGTLCNKIFGSGNTSPTLTAAPIAAGSSGPTTPTASIAIPAIGGHLGSTFPLPAGLDCSSVTTTDSKGNVTCAATNVSNSNAIYPFYLSVLPGAGYTINHESEETGPNGDEIASILFEGNGAGGFSSINVLGGRVTITLQAP